MPRHSFTPQLDDASRRAVFEMMVDEGPQFHMALVDFVGLASRRNRLKKTWKLQPGDIYDDSYPQSFVTKEVMPLLPHGTRAPSMQTQVDLQKHVVNVKIVFQ